MLRPSSAVSASSIQSIRLSSEKKMSSALTRTTAIAVAVTASGALAVARLAVTSLTDGRRMADGMKRAKGIWRAAVLSEREFGRGGVDGLLILTRAQPNHHKSILSGSLTNHEAF